MIHNLEKSDLRYILYLARTSKEKEIHLTDSQKEIIEFVERLDGFKEFGGWLEFAKKWDMEKDENAQWVISKRHISEEREWEAVVTYRAEIFPALQNGEYKKLLKSK